MVRRVDEVNMMSQITIHSDGACSGNPGPGGYAATVRVDGAAPPQSVLVRGGDPNTTNNAMELSGAAAGLTYVLSLPELTGSRVRLRADSEYVLKGLRDWSPGWKRNGWRTASGDPVKNRDLWERLDALKTRVEAVATLELEHVRGHSGDPENEAADRAAVAARDLSRREPAPWSQGPEPITRGDLSALEGEVAKFERDAVSHGYSRYRDPMHHRRSGYLFSVQKRIWEAEDTRYFVNLDVWDMAELSRGQAQRLSLEANVQFHTEDGHEGHFVNVSTPFRGFEETEAFFDQMWSSMGFGRYERADPGPGPQA